MESSEVEKQRDIEAEKQRKKLREIELSIGLPTKLSEVEKEKFAETFDSLKNWLDDSQVSVLGMNRDAAYRYIRLLIAKLQQVDVDFVGGVDPSSRAPGYETRPEQEPQEAPIPVVRPTREQVDGWLNGLTSEAKLKASELLDCMKQYLDPEGPGIDIICNRCTKEELAQCIRNADPSFEDAGSIFMKVQLE